MFLYDLIWTDDVVCCSIFIYINTDVLTDKDALMNELDSECKKFVDLIKKKHVQLKAKIESNYANEIKKATKARKNCNIELKKLKNIYDECFHGLNKTSIDIMADINSEVRDDEKKDSGTKNIVKTIKNSLKQFNKHSEYHHLYPTCFVAINKNAFNNSLKITTLYPPKCKVESNVSSKINITIEDSKTDVSNTEYIVEYKSKSSQKWTKKTHKKKDISVELNSNQSGKTYSIRVRSKALNKISKYSETFQLKIPKYSEVIIKRGDISNDTWTYSGGCDAISMELNKDATFNGIGLMIPNCTVTARLELWNYEQTTLIFKTNDVSYAANPNQEIPIQLKLVNGVPLQKSTKYTLNLYQTNSNGSSKKVNNGKTVVDDPNSGLKITFTNAKQSPNGTMVSYGAFPELYFHC